MIDLNKIAKKGHSAAFSKKANVIRYGVLLDKYGYDFELLRSSGPTVDGPWTSNAYYIQTEKKKVKRNNLVRVKNNNPFRGILG